MSPLKVNLAVDPNPDYDSTAYKVAYSRLNGVIIEGEQEAYRNYLQLAEMLPQHRDSLLVAARGERRHQRGFQSCSRQMGIKADRGWAEDVFAELHHRFAAAAERGQLVPCLLIQALVVECLAIATYNLVQSTVRHRQNRHPSRQRDHFARCPNDFGAHGTRRGPPRHRPRNPRRRIYNPLRRSTRSHWLQLPGSFPDVWG
jgi:hypothetical protein